MKGMRVMQMISLLLSLNILLSGCGGISPPSAAVPPVSQQETAAEEHPESSATQTGFITEQILDGVDGDIHYSYYLPEGYTKSKKYPMIVVMPGYDKMWFGEESSGSNLNWNGVQAWTKLDEAMIVVSAQLTDWGEKSAQQANELTAYFLENFAVDQRRVYAAGYSAGGETMSQAVSMRPDLYAAYLHGGAQWDGSFTPIAEHGVAVYIFMAENDGKRPVMVWLHGGGFSLGSANDEQYDEKYKYSANVGMTDIVDSLEWIQNNIEAFGGDPDNVTVFGQSGGGAKVLALMTSPYAKGLFDKGIVQSGATETMGVRFNTQESSTQLTENILKKLGITAENLEDIQNVSVDELEQAATEALKQTGEELKLPAALGEGFAMDWQPVVDGDFLPTDPVTEDSFAAAGADIPLLIGSNLNEWSGFSLLRKSSRPRN